MTPDPRYLLNDPAQLRDYYPAPYPAVVRKQIDHIDSYGRRLIALSPFMVLGTRGNGGLDCSPKGGEPGFVWVEDDKTLLLPDRAGNNRLDGLQNILQDPRVGMVFLIPGWQETFRVNGRAVISVDPELCARFMLNNHPAKSVVCVQVEEAFIHCGRAISFADLWNPEIQPDPAQVPSASEVFKAHLALADAAGSD